MERPEIEVHLTVRLPEPLHKKVKALAKEDMRSLNSEIIYLIEKTIKEKEKA